MKKCGRFGGWVENNPETQVFFFQEFFWKKKWRIFHQFWCSLRFFTLKKNKISNYIFYRRWGYKLGKFDFSYFVLLRICRLCFHPRTDPALPTLHTPWESFLRELILKLLKFSLTFFSTHTSFHRVRYTPRQPQ